MARARDAPPASRVWTHTEPLDSFSCYMITRTIPLFSELVIETRSTCNRTCDFCIRNSHPDREAVKPWFEEREMPADTVMRLFREAQAIGFRGVVCLQFYNEPLEDPRLPEFAALAKGMGFSYVFT